ncbi:MAG: helix-turn-helix transcriptional regulator [Planctomycetota bacterium]|jgi:predicted DNA-binding transcriptional regulator AlpA
MSDKQAGLVIDDLATLPGKSLIDEKALASALKVTPRTIRRMVSRNEIPPPTRLGGRSCWMVEKILEHFAARADKAAKEAERQARRISQLSP